MTHLFFRRPYFSLCLSAILTACAGGGTVEIPQSIVPIPTLSALDPGHPDIAGQTPDIKLQTFNTGTGQPGKIESWQVKEDGLFGPSLKNKLAYRTPDGNVYLFSTYTDPIVPNSFHPDQSLKTRHDAQPTDNGGKLFVCCGNSSQSSNFKATQIGDYLRYGTWIDKNGTADLFVGGMLADPAQMQGASDNDGHAKGKATYEVWALRTKNGETVSSSYDNSNREHPIKSEITVNFNTGKLGGKIIGNPDFGADIDFQDVNVTGNRFHGSALSDGKEGQVEGGFFGKSSWYSPAGQEIGGKVTFAPDHRLDSVFGGAIEGRRWNTEDTSTDLTPLK
ncbi:transferrin-binding protein-like solute binding protein [Neisseria sp. ZJ106]|uniref:Transferrin-binding protein-like solute binding protein n=1 Tax=Neisseria lisongii TaxID=2912188 RepID=A0AAW5AP13_9NEIS|nr:transferrin-binding protein-like solute binding protein [Neisseria lisongii]MCF7520628.1 transferrin-binding protein-like solute binding protein [Neisseria lisongii]MCF7529907.1 transferrin-binding protein-like solute binding protein [Neisseria lisongii]WCL71438.1 transferrin-binding protein-like solute binding protein [Neisseria lisongii]